MFGIKGRDTFNKPTSDIGQLVSVFHKWWLRLFPYALGLVIVVAIGMIGYIWYTYLYAKDVTEVEKKEYVDKKNKEVIFKKEKFDALKGIVLLRQERFDAERESHKDFFYKKEYKEEQQNDDVELYIISQENLQDTGSELRQE